MLHDKEMRPYDPSAHADYPSVISVVGYDVDEEAAELADIVRFLARHRVISDYSQVALLLHSVKASPQPAVPIGLGGGADPRVSFRYQ